jgi:hypothetical protein
VLVGVCVRYALERRRFLQHPLRRLVHRRLHRGRFVRREYFERCPPRLFVDVLEIGKLVNLANVVDCQGNIGRELDVVFQVDAGGKHAVVYLWQSGVLVSVEVGEARAGGLQYYEEQILYQLTQQRSTSARLTQQILQADFHVRRRLAVAGTRVRTDLGHTLFIAISLECPAVGLAVDLDA